MRRAICTRIPVTCAVRYAAELEIFPPPQGTENFDRAPLHLEVTLGRSDFQESPSGVDVGFALQFRRVIIELILDNAEIALEDRYSHSLASEVFKRSIRRTVESSSRKGAERDGGLSLNIDHIFSALKIDGKLRKKLSEEFQRGNFESIESAPPFLVVKYASGRRWEVGHSELGDPSQKDGILHGSYLSHEKGPDGQYSPLCYISPLEDGPYGVSVELRASLTDCVYTPTGVIWNEEKWMKRNRERIERRLVTKMLQEQNRADGYDPPPGEVILARGYIGFERPGLSMMP